MLFTLVSERLGRTGTTAFIKRFLISRNSRSRFMIGLSGGKLTDCFVVGFGADDHRLGPEGKNQRPAQQRGADDAVHLRFFIRSQHKAGHDINDVAIFHRLRQFEGGVHGSGPSCIFPGGIVENFADTVAPRVQICKVIQTLSQIAQRQFLLSHMASFFTIALRIDQTLTQDATGTMAYLEFETMGIPRVKTELSIAYVDHNTLQCGFENGDDHRYLQSVTAKHGVYFSRPGNGICHQVHLERFGKPGKTLIDSDSHTPTGGGIGMLAFGAGGLDVAVAMGGGAYYITMPKMFKVNLTGKLRPYVTAKDVSLELLRILSVKGGVGAIIEWGGEGFVIIHSSRGTFMVPF